MLVRIDTSSSQPLFEQIAASLRADMAAGRLRTGDRLPPAREIAQGLDVNMHTVLHAYQQLRDEGLILLRRGRGAVVAEASAALLSLHADIAALVARATELGLSSTALAALVKETTP